MKKKAKKILKLLCALLLLVAVGTGGYTYAKYRTAVTSEGGLDVAKWSFKINGETEQFENIQLINTVDERLLVNGKIAPGSGGSFTINLDASETDVALNYSIRFENEQNKPTNIVFIYNGQEFKSLKDLTGYLSGAIYADEQDKTREYIIDWNWKYQTGANEAEKEANDLIDTEEGMSGLDYTFDIVVTANQKQLEEN